MINSLCAVVDVVSPAHMLLMSGDCLTEKLWLGRSMMMSGKGKDAAEVTYLVLCGEGASLPELVSIGPCVLASVRHLAWATQFVSKSTRM